MERKIIFILLLMGIESIGCIEDSQDIGEINVERDIEFENIEYDIIKKGGYSNYTENNSEFFVINNRQEWDNIKLETLEYSEFNISRVNFQNESLLIALLGQKSSGRYIFDIIEIRKIDKTLKIFYWLEKSENNINVSTSPYVMVKVDKNNLKGTTIFILFLNDEKIVEKYIEIK